MKKGTIMILLASLFFISVLAIESPPFVILNLPTNDSTSDSIAITFSCNAIDDSGLANASLYYGKIVEVVKEFREDGSFFNITDDTQISADSPNTNYGNATEINVDGQNPHAHGLIKFPNIFGSQQEQIPLGTEIISASLIVECFNPGNIMNAYLLKENWAEGEATWNNRMNNVPWANPGADGSVSRDSSSISWDCTTTGQKAFDMTGFVQAWSNGEPNYGVIATDTGADGNDFYSSKYSAINNRPILRIRYKTVENWGAKQVQNLNGVSLNISFQATLDDKSTYKWNCLVTDVNGESSFAPADFILKLNVPVSPTSTVPNLKVAFIGDQALGASAIAVLQLIKNESADMVLHQGDFDYQDNPTAWDDQINSVLGANFPYFASIGNHDVSAWSGYQQKLNERLARIPNAICIGDLGVQSSCYYKGLFFVLTAPGTSGTGHDIYIRDQLVNDNSIWSVCSWHKNQRLMQVGGKTDETGWGVYEECRKGGGIVATAHEHSYSRTYLMNNFETQSVASTSNILVLEKGKSFAFVSGLGGHSIRPQLLNGSWWASIYTSTQGADFGALFCIFNVDGEADKARCYFKDIRNRVIDQFELRSAVEIIGNQAPIANAGNDQAVSDSDNNGYELIILNGSLSYDIDGSIVGYEWKNGTEILGTDVVITANLSAGTHNLVLIVTDNSGKISNDSVNVIVNPNQPPVANAGQDKRTNINETLTFDASGSFDSDGVIANYSWDFGDGSTANGININHAYSSAGNYTVILIVTDNGGLSNSDTVLAEVTEIRTLPSLHVGNILMSSEINKRGENRFCRASATIPILDNINQPIKEALVKGVWSGAYSDIAEGNTRGDGTITFRTNWIKGCGTFIIRVNDVIKDYYVYNSSQNIESEDSITL